MAPGKKGQEIVTLSSPKIKKSENFNPLNFRSVHISSWCTQRLLLPFTGLLRAISMWCTWCIHQSPLILPLT